MPGTNTRVLRSRQRVISPVGAGTEIITRRDRTSLFNLMDRVKRHARLSRRRRRDPCCCTARCDSAVDYTGPHGTRGSGTGKSAKHSVSTTSRPDGEFLSLEKPT